MRVVRSPMRGAVMMTRLLTIALTILWACTVSANGEPRPIDISACLTKNCMARDVHVFNPENDIKVQAWFDVVKFPDKPDPLFYPLFNVFNYSKSDAEITIGMQLLNQSGRVLVEATGKAIFKPTKNTEGSYETYLSINAQPLSSETIMQTRFVRVVYQR